VLKAPLNSNQPTNQLTYIIIIIMYAAVAAPASVSG